MLINIKKEKIAKLTRYKHSQDRMEKSQRMVREWIISKFTVAILCISTSLCNTIFYFAFVHFLVLKEERRK